MVIYCKSVHFRGFAGPGTPGQAFYEMASFSENRALRLLQESGNSFVRHNVNHLSRIYPAGWRTDSSNYSPVEMWNGGCQIGKGCLGLGGSLVWFQPGAPGDPSKAW